MRGTTKVLGLAAAMALPAGAWAADEAPLWTVQVDPLTTLLGFAHVQVERALTPAVSVYAGPHLRLFDSPLADTTEPYTGLGAEVGVRWYFAGVAPEGAWALVRGVLARVSTDTPAPEVGVGGYGSALVGYTAIFDGLWVLSGGAGAQYIDYGVAGYGPSGVFPALHTALGVAF